MPQASANFTPVSPFDNLTIGQIADALGHLKAEAAEIKAREEALRVELIARGITEAEGVLFRASISQDTRWTLDAERIRQELGELWCISHSKVSTITSVRLSAGSGTRRAA
jgi:hypothetical protein